MLRRKTYNRCVEQYSDRIHTYLIKNLGDASFAQDLTQDTFLQLWKYRKKVTETSAKTWLFKTAYNLMLNHIRKNKRTTYEPDFNESHSMVSTSNYETEDLLKEAFNQLTSEDKSLVILKDMEGYSYKEISEMHDISIANIKSKLHRARHKMRAHLEKIQSFENMKSYE